MIPIVEDYLSDVVRSRIAYLKANPDALDSILGARAESLATFKEFLQVKDISVIRGWPRTPAQLPAVCILLSNEESPQMGLGDHLDDESVVEREGTEEYTVVDTENSGMAYAHVRLGTKPLVSVLQVINKTTGQVVSNHNYWVTNERLGILAFSTGVSHGDRVEVTYIYNYSSQVGLEVLSEDNYRLEVWTSNGDSTVFLYHVIKWALLHGRAELVGKGLVRQQLSGTDFEPATSWFPDFVYRRALSFWCQHSSSIPLEEVGYIQGVYVDQSISVDLGGD